MLRLLFRRVAPASDFNLNLAAQCNGMDGLAGICVRDAKLKGQRRSYRKRDDDRLLDLEA